MNQPDRYARFVLPDEISKVDLELEQNNKNAATYTIRLEDHTLGNLLRQQLHEDESVIFAGYRIPHPLDPVMLVRIQTTDAKTPQQAMHDAVNELKQEVAYLMESLQQQCPRSPTHMPPQDPFGTAAYAGVPGHAAGAGYASGAYVPPSAAGYGDGYAGASGYGGF
eukprot:GHRR01010809.1.p2 GENE.GHRR01010809.1~~GHRR01010809.1.p2  ORF type:complete len:166 (+),score=52.94 GHRR01010809.1:419-916(+)